MAVSECGGGEEEGGEEEGVGRGRGGVIGRGRERSGLGDVEGVGLG